MPKCRPEAISGTGDAYPYTVHQDGVEISKHSRETTAVSAAGDVKLDNPAALVQVQSLLEIRLKGDCGEPAPVPTPEPTPEPIPEPAPDPVPEPTPDPEPVPPPSGALVHLPFDYASRADLLADPIFLPAEDRPSDLSLIQLDQFGMRYDFRNADSAQTIGRAISIEGHRELWIRTIWRWSPNFTTCGTVGACDHKTMLIPCRANGQDVGRWGIHIGGGGSGGPDAWVTLGAPFDRNDSSWHWTQSTGIRSHQFFDGEEHEFLLHIKHSTDHLTADGECDLVIDGGRFERHYTGIRTPTNSATRWLQLGRNKDKGNGSLQQWWWRLLEVHTTNPAA